MHPRSFFWFQWAVTVLTGMVVVRLFWIWTSNRHRLEEFAGKDPAQSYLIAAGNSSLRTHLCLVAVLLLGVMQIALVWKVQPARWVWVPPIAEFLLVAAMAIAGSQVAGDYFVACGGLQGSPYQCRTNLPDLLYRSAAWWWCGIGAIGLFLGIAWSWTARTSRLAGDVGSPAEA